MSLTTRYVSIKTIMNRLLINPMMEGIQESDIVMYIADALKLIGAPMSYDDKTEFITITEYRGELPCDLLYIQQSRRVTENGTSFQPMRYNSDTFSTAYHEIGSADLRHANGTHDNSYTLNNGMIYASFPEGTMQMSYKALPVDEDGFPLIPDNVKFIKAVEEYVKCQWYRIQWELGKIPDKVFQKVEQESAWYIGAANTGAQLMTIDQAETFRAAFSRLLLNPTSGRRAFTEFGKQEEFNLGQRAWR